MNLTIYYLMKYLRRMDLFGQPIMLNYRNKYEYQTLFGGTVSLMIIFIAASLLFGQGIALVRREKFQIFKDEITSMNPPQLNITNEIYMFALKIKDSQQGHYKKFFDFQITQYTTKSHSTNIETIALTPCSQSHFSMFGGKYMKNKITQLDLVNYQCPPLGETYSLAGTSSSELFQYVKIKIIPCQGGEEICETQQGLDQYLKSNEYFQFQFVSTTYQVLPTQVNSFGFSIDQDLYFSFVPNKFHTNADLFLQISTINDDASLIPFLHEDRITQMLTLPYENIRQQQTLQSASQYYGEFTLKLSTQQNQISKTYQQVDDYLAYAGGLIKFLISAFGVIVMSYNKYDLCLSLANRLYDFNYRLEDGSHAHDEINKNIKNMVDYVEVALRTKQDVLAESKKVTYGGILENFKNSPQIQVDLFDQEDNLYGRTGTRIYNQKSFLEFVTNKLVNYRKQLAITFRYLVTRWTERNLFYDTEHTMLIDTGVSKIKKELDIMKILDRLQIVDRLKNIILDRDQISFLENMQKPMISHKNIKERKVIRRMKKLKLDDREKYGRVRAMERLFLQYQKLKTRRNQSQESILLNAKLFDMVPYKLRPIFDFALTLHKIPDKSQIQKRVQFQGQNNSELDNDDQKEEEQQNSNQIMEGIPKEIRRSYSHKTLKEQVIDQFNAPSQYNVPSPDGEPLGLVTPNGEENLYGNTIN